MNSKLIGSHKDFFAPIVVDAVLHLDDDQDISLIGIKKETGGSMEVCFLLSFYSQLQERNKIKRRY